MGRNHARVWLSLGHDLVGIVDPVKPPDGTIPDGVRWFTDIQSMDREAIPGKPEAVSICTPTAHHRDAAIAAMELGYHCLIEKPVASSMDEAHDIRAAARRCGVVCGVGQVERFNPAVTALKGIVDAGELGEVFSMSTRRWSSMPGRIQDVGVLLDLGIHDLDVMRYLVGREPVSVYAVAGGSAGERGDGEPAREDRATVVVDWGGGVSGVVEVSWRVPRKVRSLEVTGSRGLASLDFMGQSVAISQSAYVGLDPGDLWGGRLESVVREVPVASGEPLRAEVSGFVGAVAGEGMSQNEDIVGVADGIGSLRLALAAVESTRTGKPVRLG